MWEFWHRYEMAMKVLRFSLLVLRDNANDAAADNRLRLVFKPFQISSTFKLFPIWFAKHFCSRSPTLAQTFQQRPLLALASWKACKIKDFNVLMAWSLRENTLSFTTLLHRKTTIGIRSGDLEGYSIEPRPTRRSIHLLGNSWSRYRLAH